MRVDLKIVGLASVALLGKISSPAASLGASEMNVDQFNGSAILPKNVGCVASLPSCLDKLKSTICKHLDILICVVLPADYDA